MSNDGCSDVAFGWEAQHQAAQQLLQTQQQYQQLYGSLLAAAAAAAAASAVCQNTATVQRQATPTAGITAFAVPDDRPVKKSPGIWSPASDIENNNNSNTSGVCGSKGSVAIAKWNRDQAKMRYVRISACLTGVLGFETNVCSG